MKKSKIITIVLSALTVLHFLVGGLMGFIMIKGEDLKTFNFLFWISLPMAIFCLLVDWYSLGKADVETPYTTLKLRKWRIVKERRIYKSDNRLQALELGIYAWLLSLVVPLFAFKVVWPDTFWPFSFNALIEFLGTSLVLIGVIMGIIKNRRKKGGQVCQ